MLKIESVYLFKNKKQVKVCKKTKEEKESFQVTIKF